MGCGSFYGASERCEFENSVFELRRRIKNSYIGNFKPVAGTDTPNFAPAFFHKVSACPSQMPNRHYGAAINTLGTRS
jgi:hypothetical protein